MTLLARLAHPARRTPRVGRPGSASERWPRPVATLLTCGAGNRSPESQRRLAESMRGA